jgi:hypothetical protein
MSSLTPKPKVVAAVLAGIIASALLSNLTLITPDLFEGLGKFAGLVYGLTITVVIGVAGWLKSDATAADTAPAQADPASVDLPPLEAPTAPSSVFPAAAVASAEAAEVTPVFTPPAV